MDSIFQFDILSIYGFPIGLILNDERDLCKLIYLLSWQIGKTSKKEVCLLFIHMADCIKWRSALQKHKKVLQGDH